MLENVSRVVIGFRGLGLLALVSAASAACGSGGGGADGPAGVAGPDGTPGVSGARGADGRAGPSGAAAPTPPVATDAPKAVYTLSNDATENAVFVYTRAADGTLTPKDAYATGGKGSAAGLGDQGALVFDPAEKLFFAVNAGDDSISMLALRPDGSLSLVSKIGSGGKKPVSVTASGGVAYALNAGDASSAANISGFRVSPGGLVRIEGSTRPLSAPNPAPAQIQLTPDGKMLVVTEKATNTIDTYVLTDGVAGSPNSQPSAGKTPFGFAFGSGGQLLVSEAFGGADGQGAASSYTLGADGTLTARSASVVSAQSAPCWVTVAATHAYVTNTKSNDITAYTIGADGALALLAGSGVAAQTGMAPIDVAVTDEGRTLYALNAKDHSLSIFAIAADGSLTKKPDFAGLPELAVGLVAR